MAKRRKRRVKNLPSLEVPKTKEKLNEQKGNVPLNIGQQDRISFSVLKNEKKQTVKIENISYEILIENEWQYVVRYDDHGGQGSIHPHYRLSLTDLREIESSDGIIQGMNKDQELAKVFKDIKKNYLKLRSDFLKNSGLDLY